MLPCCFFGYGLLDSNLSNRFCKPSQVLTYQPHSICSLTAALDDAYLEETLQKNYPIYCLNRLYYLPDFRLKFAVQPR
jgi:hypothetical protein